MENNKGKAVRAWEHRAILEGGKSEPGSVGTRGHFR